MFFVIIFLALAALGAYLFPEWSWATVLLLAFACVATLRLALWFGDRAGKGSGGDDPS